MLRPALLASALVVIAIGPAAGDQGLSGRTPIFVCGEDQKLAQPLPITWGNIVLAGDGRLFIPCPALAGTPGQPHTADHREMRESDVIFTGFGRIPGTSGLVSRSGSLRQGQSSPEVRWRAAQALARMTAFPVGILTPLATVTVACNARIFVFEENGSQVRWQPGQMFFLNRDQVPAVRREAAYAVGVLLSSASADYSENLVTGAAEEIRACASSPLDAATVGVWLESLGAVRYKAAAQIAPSEAFLVQHSNDLNVAPKPRILGAARGLEALTRQNPKHRLQPETIARLRQMTAYGQRAAEPAIDDVDARVRRLAVMALRSSGNFDFETMRAVVTDGDWQVRRLVAMSLQPDEAEQMALATALSRDFAFQVRYELVAVQRRLAIASGLCAPLVRFFDDDSPVVVAHAIAMLPGKCNDLAEVVQPLEGLADALSHGTSQRQWHVPARALDALARLAPEKAAALLPSAIGHSGWHVRAAAASTAVTLNDEPAAVRLAADREPNVRTAALNALHRLRSPSLARHAIHSIRTTSDYQLLITAATVLEGNAGALRDGAVDALALAIRRISDEESDTSSEARVALVERFAEVAAPGDRAGLLTSLAADWDDAVRAAARKALGGAAGSAVNPQRRYPYQPTEAALYRLPRQAVIDLETGSVTLTLLTDVAPVTVARFAELVQQGFYKDRAFHRVVPNFVAHGGGPGDNVYGGATRFLRDEVGPQASHVRGAVAMSTRGPDKGDGQIFIDLVDLPQLDRQFTVFAYVTEGMPLVDRLVEGAKIVNISVR